MLKHEANLEALNNELVGVVKESMQPAHVSLWLRPDMALNRDEVLGRAKEPRVKSSRAAWP